jgi:hypothetical protein
LQFVVELQKAVVLGEDMVGKMVGSEVVGKMVGSEELLLLEVGDYE